MVLCSRWTWWSLFYAASGPRKLRDVVAWTGSSSLWLQSLNEEGLVGAMVTSTVVGEDCPSRLTWTCTSCSQCLCSGGHGLSEAIAQGDCVRMVLGRSLRQWRERENVPPLTLVTDSKGIYDHLHNETIGPSEEWTSATDLAIIREDLSRPRMFLRWVDGKAQVIDALTKLHGDGHLLRAVCRQAFTVLVEAPEIMAARRQEKKRT